MRPALRAARFALPALLATVAAAPAAHAEATVTLRVSTHYAVSGFPVTATVTSTASGKVWLSQSRRDGIRSTNGGYCGHPQQEILNDLTSVQVVANKPVKVSINPSRLQFFGGQLFNPGTGCWDQATLFNQLVASLAADDNQFSVPARTTLQRIF